MDDAEGRYLHRTIEALKFASPFCLATFFENGLAHCIEASMSGAAVLTRHRIKAKAVPCCVGGNNNAEALSLSLGMTRRQVYDRFDKRTPNLPSVEEWVSTHGQEDEQATPLHMVIKAEFAGEHAIIDLTFGQVRAKGCKDAPLHLAVYEKDWFQFDRGNWTFGYMDCPHKADVWAIDAIRNYKDPTYENVLNNLVELALQCDLDIDDFFEAVQRNFPDEYRASIERMNELMGPG